jgi:glycoside/pentoside/hexuronide:cation symporter, GPH family
MLSENAKKRIMIENKGRLSVREKIGYSLGDVASSLYFNMFMLFLLYFYTDIFGISAAAAGTMIGITRLWESFSDPIIGMISDRTNTRWGKYRPYILWTAVPFAFIGILTFSTPDLPLNHKIIYAYITYSLLNLTYSIINVPYTSLMGVLTPNSLERTEVSSYKFFGAAIGGVIVQYSTLHLVTYFGKGNEAKGFQLTAIAFSIFVTIMFLLCFFSTKERVKPQMDKQSSIKEDLRDLIHNRPWWVLLVIGLFSLTWISIKLGSTVFYFKYYVGKTELAATFMVVGTIFNAAGLLLTKRLSKIFGKKKLFIYAMVGNAIFMAAMVIPHPSQIGMMFTFQILSSFISGPAMPLLWAMYADSADFSEWRTNRRATGLVFSAAMFSQKMGWSLGATFAGILLSCFGYQANVTQTPDSIMGIRLLMSVIPGLIALLSVFIFFFYKLDEKTMMTIEADLEERRTNK